MYRNSVSVVIPTKDRLRFLKLAIPMYLSHPEVKEVIVIVDGSMDGTREYLDELVREDSRVRYFDNGLNRGIPYSRNLGIDHASGKYVFSTEDDLEIDSGFFRILLDHKIENKYDVISARNIFRYEYETREESIQRNNNIKGSPINLRTIEINTGVEIKNDESQIMIASPMLGETGLFKAIRFDESLKVNFWREETDFQFSAQEMGYIIGSCPHAVSYNFVIKNDRSGAHAAVGFRRTKWVIKNNWFFVNKHEKFIKEHCKIGNKYFYIVSFTVRRTVIDILIPLLNRVKVFYRNNGSDDFLR